MSTHVRSSMFIAWRQTMPIAKRISKCYVYIQINILVYRNSFIIATHSLKIKNSDVILISHRQHWGQHTRFWCLLHQRTAKAQTSLHICTVSPEPLLLTYRKYGSRGMGRLRNLPSLNSAFVFRLLESIISKLATSKISLLASLCSWAGWFWYDLIEIPR